MLANVIKQTMLVGVMLTASFMASAESRQVYGQDRAKLRTIISESDMRYKALIYGSVMTPDGDEQVSIRDFRMLKQWYDMYSEGTLPDRGAYKKNVNALFELYGKTSGWGYQDYVDARYEFAVSDFSVDGMFWETQLVEATDWNLSWPAKIPLKLLAGLLGGGVGSAVVNAGKGEGVGVLTKMSEALPAAGMGLASAWILYELVSLGYWEWNYGSQYRGLTNWQSLGHDALKELKDYSPDIAEARNKIMESLISYYVEPMDEHSTQIALQKCIDADGRYLVSDAYNEGLFAGEDVKSLSDVLNLAYSKARNGIFTLELHDDGYSAKQNLRFDIMLCNDGKFQFLKSQSHDSEYKLYRLYAPELLVELVENLSLLSDLNQFRFHVTSVPFYFSLANPIPSYRVNGFIRSPASNAEEKETSHQ